MATRGFPPPFGMRRIRPVVRSATSASPSGRNAMPHGTCRPVAIVRIRGTCAGVAVARAVAGFVAAGDALGVSVALPEVGSLDPQPASASASTSRLRRITPG